MIYDVLSMKGFNEMWWHEVELLVNPYMKLLTAKR